MTEILLDLTLIILGGFLTFGVGYVVGSWNMIDKYDKELSDMLAMHMEEIESLKKRLNVDGEGWKL